MSQGEGHGSSFLGLATLCSTHDPSEGAGGEGRSSVVGQGIWVSEEGAGGPGGPEVLEAENHLSEARTSVSLA